MKRIKVTTSVPKGMEVVTPVQGSFTEDQRKKMLLNFLKFSSVPALAFLVGIQSGLSIQQAFSLSLVPALINSLIDVITKFNSDTPYLRDK